MSKLISIIVAVADNQAIGFNNQLLTHISADLKRFKKITDGHPVIMGRNTWFSLPKRPLPNRMNIVITNQPDEKFQGAVTAYSIDEAMASCPENEECFVMGGAMVYRQFFPIAQKLYLTRIHKTFEADTFFPEIKEDEWQTVDQVLVDNDEQAGLPYSFIDLVRK